jgi:hypothetical protein
MKILAIAAFAAVSAISLSACETYGPHDGGYASAGYVDGYYDDFYGPFDAGYWGDDGVFWYRGADHQFHRDGAGHFRREANAGFHSFHSRMVRNDHHDHG